MSKATSSTSLVGKEERTCLPVEIDTEDEEEHHGNKCYNVTMDFISLVLAVVEIGLVIYLSVDHFSHSMGIIALAMLAPLVLNFVGVTYFFSNKHERTEFERVGNMRCAKDLFQVPILGPVFTSLKVLWISSGCSSSKTHYARFEASAIKMKQAESFFRAAPEALVQLTVLFITTEEIVSVNNYLECAVVVVSVLTLAEANMYGIISNYYKMFHEYECEDWKLPHLSVWQKMILLFHSITSIGSRIAAVAFLKSAMKYIVLGNITQQKQTCGSMMNAMATRHKRSAWYNSDYSTIPFVEATTTMRPIRTSMRSTFSTVASTSSMGTATTAAPSSSPIMCLDDANRLAFLVMAVMMVEIGVRIILFYIARLIKYIHIGKGIPSGCYESVNYGWRATILDFGFQSKNILVQVWFYVENLSFFGLWWFMVRRKADKWVQDTQFFPMAGIFLLFTILSIFFLFACRGMELHDLKTPFKAQKSNSKK